MKEMKQAQCLVANMPLIARSLAWMIRSCTRRVILGHSTMTTGDHSRIIDPMHSKRECLGCETAVEHSGETGAKICVHVLPLTSLHISRKQRTQPHAVY